MIVKYIFQDYSLMNFISAPDYHFFQVIIVQITQVLFLEILQNVNVYLVKNTIKWMEHVSNVNLVSNSHSILEVKKNVYNVQNMQYVLEVIIFSQLTKIIGDLIQPAIKYIIVGTILIVAQVLYIYVYINCQLSAILQLIYCLF